MAGFAVALDLLLATDATFRGDACTFRRAVNGTKRVINVRSAMVVVMPPRSRPRRVCSRTWA